jgi:TP901-1 family phage major tail protein
MTAQSGQNLLIKIDMDGNDDFQTIAGLRASKIAFNAQTINTTNMSSPGRWRELIEKAGVRSAQISGSGVFLDSDTDARIQALFFDGRIPKMQMVIPDFGTIEGKFQISALEFAGNFDGEVNYDMSFSSAGELLFRHETTV